MLIKEPYNATILGLTLSITDEQRVLNVISEKVRQNRFLRPYFIVTAYSEFLLEAKKNQKFAKAVKSADLVLADGVSILAAEDYLRNKRNSLFGNIYEGLKVGLNVFQGKYTYRITGVNLIKKITQPGTGIKKVFLLGGFEGVAGKLADKLKTNNPNLEILWDTGPQNISDELGVESREMKKIIEKIIKFAPDVLLVAFGRFKQEMWIAENLKMMKVKVVIGVGSAFDELVGAGVWSSQVPEWVNKRGLKWLWRALRDVKHWPRVWRAVVVFPWKVWRNG